jgi:ABC-2 type transport system permease protein
VAAAPAGFLDRTSERASLFEALQSVVSHRELLRNLVFRDLKLKYRGSVLGFLWSLANPLLMVVVYTIAFQYILRNNQPNLPFLLLLGVLAWTFFANAAVMSTGAIIDSGGLVRAVRFPRAILPMAIVLFNLVQYVLTLLVFLPIMLLVLHVRPAGSMLTFPLVLACQVMFTAGVALLLAAATAYFRDVRHLVDVVLPMLFWLTPIVYPLSIVPEGLRPLILLSPMSPFVTTYDRIFIDRAWPEPHVALLSLAYGVLSLVIGSAVFRAVEDDLAERL